MNFTLCLPENVFLDFFCCWGAIPLPAPVSYAYGWPQASHQLNPALLRFNSIVWVFLCVFYQRF